MVLYMVDGSHTMVWYYRAVSKHHDVSPNYNLFHFCVGLAYTQQPFTVIFATVEREPLSVGSWYHSPILSFLNSSKVRERRTPPKFFRISRLTMITKKKKKNEKGEVIIAEDPLTTTFVAIVPSPSKTNKTTAGSLIQVVWF